TTVINNLVGINLAGQALPNAQNGMQITGSVIDSNIGFAVTNGTVVAAPNTIARNPSGGIASATIAQAQFVGATAAGNTSATVSPRRNSMLYNRVFGNRSIAGTLGIDLAGLNLFEGDGVTANDPGDGD